MADPLALRLADWLGDLRWHSLPARQQELAALRLVDSFGLILGGAGSEATAIARSQARQSGGAGRAALVGSEAGASAGWAALVNGIAAHCWDFDDTFPDSVVHPGSAVVPTALAIGEESGATGEEILTAIAGGYEIAARLAGAGARRFHARGFHASGIFAPVVAAFVAGCILRLPPVAMTSAVGLAASMSGGLLAFLEDGSWSKWLHFGWGNFGGILAARFAQNGFRGPAGALDGRHNLYAAFLGDTPDPRDIENGLGSEWRNEAALFKLYPCAHVIHPYIDLALDLRHSLALGPDAITHVLCEVAPWAVPIVCEPVAEKTWPQTTLQAIASLPFHVAAALVDGRIDLGTIAPDRLHRPDLLALAARVEHRVADLPGFAARLELTTASGERHSRAGAAAAAVTAGRLREKFLSLAIRALPEAAVDQAFTAALTLAEAPDVAPLTRFLAQAGARAAPPSSRGDKIAF